MPILAAGFAAGALGGALAAAGSAAKLAPLVLLGLLGVGAAGGTALLARTAAGDMYPPERRARGIALVLSGAVFGAILGPAVFSPLVADRDLDGGALAVLWLAAGGFMVIAGALVLCVRPDPRRIARMLAADDRPDPPAAPLSELLRRPGVIPALLAAQASFSVMVGLMTLTGVVVVDHQHHPGHDVFPIIGAHVLGMYALVLVIGDVIDRIGRTPALAGGLVIMACAAHQPRVGDERARHRRGAVRARHRLEPLLRGRHRRAVRPHTAVGARQAARVQRPAVGADRGRAGADRRRGADHAGRDRAGRGRRGARARARAVDLRWPRHSQARTVPAAADHRLGPPGDRSCAPAHFRITVRSQPAPAIARARTRG